MLHDALQYIYIYLNVYRGYIGIMEKKIEATIMGYIGTIGALPLFSWDLVEP